MDISAWLKQATKELKDIGIASNRLDAELILSHTLRKPRTYLHAHLDEMIDARRKDIADARLELRKERIPLAYIVGHKEFYGRLFKVTPATLIPRPESEDVISLLLKLTAEDIAPKTLVDVGTGSGCLAITAKLERPNLSVIACDISKPALIIAKKNSEQLQADIEFIKSDLLRRVITPADIIIANLPYVDRSWPTSPETKSEPDLALYAGDQGLDIILRLIPQAASTLRHNGLLLYEADPEQHDRIIATARPYGLHPVTTQHYCLVLQKSEAKRQ